MTRAIGKPLVEGFELGGWPTDHDARRLQPYEVSKRRVEVFRRARKFLSDQNIKPTLERAADLIGCTRTTLREAEDHVAAVEVYGISPDHPKGEALRRLALLNPTARIVAKKVRDAEGLRSDIEQTAETVLGILALTSSWFSSLDAGAVAVALKRYPKKRGATTDHLIDLRAFFDQMETTL